MFGFRNKHIFILLSVFLSISQINGEEIIIEAKKIKGKAQNAATNIFVTKELIDESVEQNIAELIGEAQGIQDYSTCSNCGAKKLSMNGTKSESMSILLDGLPLYSTISQFYGLDSLSDFNLDSYEVFSSPGEIKGQFESLSGYVNLNTVTPSLRNSKFKIEIKNSNIRDSSFVVSKNSILSPNIAQLISVSTKYDSNIDIDKNKVAELPEKKTENVFMKTFLRTEKVDSEFLYNYSTTETIGGNTDGYRLLSYPSLQADENDFEGNDVRNKYTGSSEKISDYINIERHDSYLKNSISFGNDLFANINAGHSTQKQHSFFMHGFDYKNKIQVSAFESSFLKMTDLGNFNVNLLVRRENLRSKSKKLYIEKTTPLKKDDYNYNTNSILLSYEKEHEETDYAHSYSFGVKLENKKLHVLGFNKKISEDITLLPYFNSVWKINNKHEFSFSSGLRQRAPIVNIETQHGNSEYGYDVQVTEFEKVESVGVSYSYIKEKYQVNLDYQALNLKNIVFGQDRATTSQSTIFKNSTQDYIVNSMANSYLFDIYDNSAIEVLFEKFIHPIGYKKIQKDPLIEERAQVKYSFEQETYKTSFLLQWFAARELSIYGNNNYYNYAKNDVLETPPLTLKDQKRQKAPSFFTLDWYFSKKFSENFTLNLGVDNIFDYTQTKSAKDSPLSFAKHGDHYHLDNMHLWGPLKGRMIWTRLRFEF